MAEIVDRYDPSIVESRWYREWEERGLFGADPASPKPPYCIVIPPPNVTGSLHWGHALNNTLQDILIRYKRMDGYNALWVPGTDHASIAVHVILERQLAAEGKTRHDIGREAFLERAWKWKEESGGTIIRQLKRLGASCDWSRERFTMDPGLSRAVRETFVRLYEEGLIYQDDYIVNWCPSCQTVLSDLEVEREERDTDFVYIKYGPLTLGTVRPETKLGDTAVAVHPKDKRYAKYVGKTLEVPSVEGTITLRVIADSAVDPKFGTGVIKVTPGHDPIDFEIGRRHNLPTRTVIGFDGRMTAEAGKYAGLDRFEARKRIVEDMQQLGLIERIEPYRHSVGLCYRSKTVVEPLISRQWYVNVKPLAEVATKAVRGRRIKILPRHWVKTYYHWMDNIRPWCISRQLWWGHQIPAWYGPDGKVFVAETEDEAVSRALAYYAETEAITPMQGHDMALDPASRAPFLIREESVLDTWFSSALWPFSTLGWPDETPELKRYYPTDVLVTGFDIIFFWVARMMMMGLHFMKEVPFRTVYIHALVRDEKGAKMSKSKGNIIDPLELIDRYGADALRFTLAAMAAQGRDIKLATSRVEGYRNFATKLWNACRFAEMNGCATLPGFEPDEVEETLNRWIGHETARAVSEVTEAIEAFRFNDAASAVYRFVWNVYCDWYLELSKPVLMGPDSPAKTETQAMVAFVRDQILALLHPFMPFVTEELWSVTAQRVRPEPAIGPARGRTRWAGPMINSAHCAVPACLSCCRHPSRPNLGERI